MSKAPSEATQIRSLTRDLNQERQRSSTAIRAQVALAQRLKIAETDRDEWKARFDLLLKRRSASPVDEKEPQP